MITPAETITIETDEIGVWCVTADQPVELITDEIDIETDEIDVYYVPRGVNR